MQSVKLEVSIPRVLFSFGMREEDVQREIEKWLVISLFKSDRISSGKAGSLLGMGRRGFLDLLDKEGIAYFDYSETELREEFEAVRQLEPVEGQG